MIRFGFNQFGDAHVFEAITADRPTPKPGQVLLQVLGFGMNPYDVTLRTGAQAEMRPMTFPIVPGTDVVGRVVELGEGVTDFAEGDIVMNYRPIGGYSEYVVASTSKIYKKPRHSVIWMRQPCLKSASPLTIFCTISSMRKPVKPSQSKVPLVVSALSWCNWPNS